ncbi:DUF3696 domain-containing protein [Vibrio cholerae]|uniref:DUF3696 domain-containing protein n=1 Tax=Vibrio cholerae TaxID=666 RepID=A0A544CFI0_VIBCL|nr:DUF3696 domain-containing protein [Vibrio cholerae]ELJ8516202.1 DUF3696 domain-containing protein [Vibrio cholerae]TQP17351.1 DUF3696 domain-containing protein [Vibrio cholerae]TQP88477.1 DUF3696 domain-containing protein [Vibrio cholerae]TQQ13053.1 DUF3696 domain-containing protein [Vibrio cholerae]TQQ58164.1 DUF3696 domain-containing protein [Vibrio cholerae]
MIKEISIKGYKSFLDEKLILKNLTILTGLNGSGKSSFIQSVRMVFESNKEQPFLEGLGDYSELKSVHAGPSPIISITAKNERNETNSIELNATNFSVEREFGHIIEYISAERLGPKTSLPIKLNRSISVGEQGEFCADFYNKFKSSLVCKNLRHPEQVSNTLENQLAEWMRGISPNLKFKFSVDSAHDLSTIEIDYRRATNTGFGISYSLPIVLSSLVLSSENCFDFEHPHAEVWYEDLKSKGAILIVENPEAHIHPSGQTQLGILLALLSASGVQVIMETHSDHVIDGVRIAVKECGNLNAEDVIIKYFVKNSSEPSKCHDIYVMPNGSLSHWPEGFFDQIQANLRRLARRD